MGVDVWAAPLIIIACFMLLIMFWYSVSRKPKHKPFCLRRFNAENEWETVCTFRDQTSHFAYGMECGMLYEKMQRLYEIHDNFHQRNKEQILDFIRSQDWTIEHIADKDENFFELHIIDNVTPRPGVLPFLPPQDTFDPPTDWAPDNDDEDEGAPA